MKICPVGAELFHVEGWTDRRTDRHEKAESLFTILQARLQIELLERMYKQYVAISAHQMYQ